MNVVKRRLLNNNQSIRTPKNRYDDTPNGKSKLFHKPMSTGYFFSIIVLILIVFSLVIVIEKQLPIGRRITDEDQYPNSFIAERAYRILKNLTRIGPRIAGSYENEVLAVKVLSQEIDSIVKNAHNNHKIEVDIQKASGAFNLEFLDGMTNVYQDVQNVVVKVGSRIESPHSLLINCHFDSVFDSPGASDDGASCAVMLEILRVLTKSEKILRHNIIFLFNGGEENFMPASHGFITQHKWANEIRAFINLEACGAGGREVLFQAGPNHPWILETYSEEVPYPYASSLAQEIFQSGVIPGDTDYRIFRDFGNISGLDFAWSANGYVYHTKFDRIEQIPLGSLQRTGDNILALARGMAQGHQLSNVDKYRAGNLVFFDFLGAFVVRWTMPVADVINVLSVIFSLFTLYSNIKNAKTVEGIQHKLYVTKLVNCMIGVFISWIMPIVFCLAMAVILTLFGRSMSWYARPLWAFFIYVIPTFVISLVTILVHAKYYHKDLVLSPWAIFQFYYDAYQIIWTVVLCLGICVRIRSSFIALTWVFFIALGNILKSVFFGKWRDPKRWLLLHILTFGLPFVQCFYLIIGALYLFIPIMGRAGAGSHAELLIAVMIGALFSMVLSGAVPLILLVRRVEKIFSVLIGVYFISLAVLILTPAGYPYSGENGSLAPQRFMIAHTKRTFHDTTGNIARVSNGYWIVDMDVNSPHTVDNHVPQMQHAELVDRDCADYVYCGLPYLVPVLTMIWKTHWVPGPEPDLLRPVNVSWDRQVIDSGQRIILKVDGPTHIGVIISPTIDVSVSNWSLPTDAPLPGPLWNGRQTYFIYYAYGLDAVPLRFSIDFKVPQSHSGPIMDLAITSHYLFGSGKANKEFSQFVDQFPNWSAVNYWTATYESWIV